MLVLGASRVGMCVDLHQGPRYAGRLLEPRHAGRGSLPRGCQTRLVILQGPPYCEMLRATYVDLGWMGRTRLASTVTILMASFISHQQVATLLVLDRGLGKED
jgi:hypothetical protein